ncbi:MAG TPA: PHB depolymerase family esterase, partial [Polyangiaceae bacterium]|nr:PHB depolymerase family esterase [Polyangiaceae bacterium]
MLTGLAALLVGAQASAASLKKVDNWGASGVPATASMYIYVPDKPATKPPLLVLSHFCSGTASAVFGQAQTGGLIKAADQYGFIVVVPQTSKNCWDVGSTKALTHDGGGDTQAVAQMVKYAITTYQADAERVYATGDSSGGMMTQALLAVYPEVFKAGAAFAGVPAGCWAAGNPDGSWSNQCADGQVSHSAKEWGDSVRAMEPGYAGRRPRVQLFHGDADDTIDFKNQGEAIKEWTDVLGLSATPTSTDTVTLGTHQATRQRWQSSCGYVVLETYASKGGDHGPSDALFASQYVVPFLGLDKTGPDPELAACAGGGSGGASTSGGAGGVGPSGGAGTAT